MASPGVLRRSHIAEKKYSLERCGGGEFGNE
jgi:hypothetical protein